MKAKRKGREVSQGFGKGKESPPRGAARRKGRRPPSPPTYPLEFRRRAVRLHLEEGVPVGTLVSELGVCYDTLRDWVTRYEAQGEAGLQPLVGGTPRGKPKLPAAVHEAIAAVRREHPGFGVRRIAQWLHRTLLLPGSAETVRRSLRRAQPGPPKARPKPKKNPPKPRFFERASPNQMWQTDIFTFQLNGHNAYLIGFIDDHSRYLVGLGVYRGQTAENVLEVYRRAVGEHGAPKEMLTDNGRQYVAWHGKTRFQVALARDRVQHIRSAPHHPMTLGKIERFWKTIWEEFLERARFETFESAVERIGWWVQYYNHKRPHQGIGGSCPADRYFAIQQEVRQSVEQEIAQNVEELALRGKPREPFYLVGRVGGQNVVLRAEHGQVKITVDGQETGGKADECERNGGEEKQGAHGAQRAGEVPGGAGAVDGPAAAVGDLPGTAGSVEPAFGLAGTGDGGYAGGVGAAHTAAGGAGSDAGPAHGAPAGPQTGAAGEPDRPGGPDEGPAGAGEAGDVEAAPAGGPVHEADIRTDAAGDPAGAGGSPERESRGGAVGDLAQELLPVGAPGARGDAGGADAGAAGTAAHGAGGGDGPAGAGGCAPQPGERTAQSTAEDPGGAGDGGEPPPEIARR